MTTASACPLYLMAQPPRIDWTPSLEQNFFAYAAPSSSVADEEDYATLLPYAAQLALAEYRLQDALYSEAAELYQIVWEEILKDADLRPQPAEATRPNPPQIGYKSYAAKVLYRLAEAHYLAGNAKSVLELFQETDIPLASPFSQTAGDALFILALAYKAEGQDRSAIDLLELLLEHTTWQSSSYRAAAEWELATAYYALGDLPQAHQRFTEFTAKTKASHSLANEPNPLQGQLVCQAYLYLARIELAQGDAKAAGQLLQNLPKESTILQPLHKELAFLKGKIELHQHHYVEACKCFEDAAAHPESSRASQTEALYHLGLAYLKAAESYLFDKDMHLLYLCKSQKSFEELLVLEPSEQAYLALGQCYIIRGRSLQAADILQKAEELLGREGIFESSESRAQALLLRAEAATTYEARDKLYSELTKDERGTSISFAQGWYLRGLNDFEEGQNLAGKRMTSEAKQAFERALSYLKIAFELLYESDRSRAAWALKYQALCCFNQQTPETSAQAFAILDDLIQTEDTLLQALSSPDEIFYLRAFIASHILMENQGPDGQSSLNDSGFDQERFLQTIEETANYLSLNCAASPYTGDTLYLLGTIYYSREKFQAAEAIFMQIAEKYSDGPHAGDALFFASQCMHAQGKNLAIVQDLRQQTYLKYPQSTCAAEAYFKIYNCAEYLTGDIAALQHLQGMPKRFPQSPYLIYAHYLLGLDQKQLRRNQEGKLIHKRNLTAAIDAFQAAETAFEEWTKRSETAQASEQLAYFTPLRYRATLERALANLCIAEESRGAKKQIYLEYSQEVFQKLLADIHDPAHSMQWLDKSESFPLFHQEASFGLAQTFLKGGDDKTAEEIYDGMLASYATATVTRGYFLSRVWYEKGMIAMRGKQFDTALYCLEKAEDAGKGKLLSTDQRLDLWIQQSHAHSGLSEFDEAMSALSKVINEDVISRLRLKAMYLRAEVYELEGRSELALKQLEALAKKGGEWALKAQNKLHTHYGHP